MTKREKSLNETSFKEIIKRNDSMNNKYSSLRNSSQKGSLKNIKNNIHFFWNQNKLNNKDLNQKFNSSQKNLFTPKKMNKLDNSINLNSFKPLSKSKQNTNYLNRTFYYPKSSIKTKNNNFGLNSTFSETPNSKKLNIKKKLYIDPKTTNKYLAPIIESNIAIENENHLKKLSVINPDSVNELKSHIESVFYDIQSLEPKAKCVYYVYTNKSETVTIAPNIFVMKGVLLFVALT
jgi:hypothetical protein